VLAAKPDLVFCALLAAAALAPAAAGLLPATSVEGALLSSASPGPELEVGVYGRAAATAGEPAMVALQVRGTNAVTISSGLVLLACRKGALSFAEAPPPAGAYIPWGQWAPDYEADWQQLLVIGAESLWATRIVPLAPLQCRADAGALLDAVVFQQAWAAPPADSSFRSPDGYDVIGVAFVADQTVQNAGDVSAALKGAHALKLSFQLIFKDPNTPLWFWAAFTANGKHFTQQLAAAPATRAVAPTPGKGADEAPVLEKPAEGAGISRNVAVAGKTGKPGSLVVAWLEARDPLKPETPLRLSTVRRIADASGAFAMTVPLPQVASPGATTSVYELHVRTEAPGYRSPEAVRRLQRQAEQ